MAWGSHMWNLDMEPGSNGCGLQLGCGMHMGVNELGSNLQDIELGSNI